MNVQFDWWLLLVGLVIGAGLTWLVLAEVRRRDDDLSRDERAAEADWIVANLAARGMDADTEAVQEVLRIHRTYLANAPSTVSVWDAGDPSWPTPEDIAAAEREAPAETRATTADGVIPAADVSVPAADGAVPAA
ncbi:MAG: hypothetical protein ACHQ3P_03550, partial [Candidatus Limnocylindrales bacterium]